MAHGNAEVINLFEIWLERARAGKICHATVTACELPNKVACDFAGTVELDFAIPYALDTLKLKIGEFARLASGPPSKNLTADYVCYNVADSPVSFDFLAWLIDAEMTRVREKAPAPLKIAFVNGGNLGLNTPERLQMFVGVLRPLVRMLGVVEDEGAVGGRSDHFFVLKRVTEASKSGEPTPILRASTEATEVVANLLQGKKPVTITLRESKNWPHRNSNLEAWLKFADSIDEEVVFVRDTAKAGEPLKGRFTFPMASTNLDIRLALYEQSKMNFFVANGPFCLALFSSAPWRSFVRPKKDDPYFCNTIEFWKESQGMEVGEQFPWSRSDQRIVWEDDSYEALRSNWNN